MDKDRVEGAGDKLKGNIKETAGKVTGDSKLQAEGKADQAEGAVKNFVGGVKDTVATRPTRQSPADLGGRLLGEQTRRPSGLHERSITERRPRGLKLVFVKIELSLTAPETIPLVQVEPLRHGARLNSGRRPSRASIESHMIQGRGRRSRRLRHHPETSQHVRHLRAVRLRHPRRLRRERRRRRGGTRSSIPPELHPRPGGGPPEPRRRRPGTTWRPRDRRPT